MTRPVEAFTADRLARQAGAACHCWRVTRTDGVEVGLTDHDEDVAFGGATFRAEGGAEGTALRRTAGLGADDAELSGVLSSGRITDEDLGAGRYDGARVELWRVDWEAPEARLRLAVGTLGEVARAGAAWTAELRGLKHALDRQAGRLFGRACDAEVGDARCRVDLKDPAFGAEVAVASADASVLAVTGADGFEAGWFTGGEASVLDGPLAGLRRPVREHADGPGGASLALWRALPGAPAPGTRLRVTAGCDKRWGTCRAKFANGLNFRGAPHMPGNDALTAYPVPGEGTR